MLEPIESKVHRDFTLDIERDGEGIKATIEMTPAPGDRRLGRVVDALYWQDKTSATIDPRYREYSMVVTQIGERVRVVVHLAEIPGDRRLGKMVDALYWQSKVLSSS